MPLGTDCNSAHSDLARNLGKLSDDELAANRQGRPRRRIHLNFVQERNLVTLRESRDCFIILMLLIFIVCLAPYTFKYTHM